MTDLRTAAQQALEAICSAKLCEFNSMSSRREMVRLMDEAIAALRAALAQQAEPVEPVAWMVYTEGGTSAYVTDNPNDLVGAYGALPLYTAPPQRKPLTDEEIRDLWSWSMTAEAERTATTQQHAFARAVERAHGITGDNNG